MDHLPSALRRRALPTVTAAVAALVLTGCGGEDASSSTSSPGGTGSGPEEVAVSTLYGDVPVPGEPERVVTLAESALDVALSVGVTPVGTAASRGGDSAPAYLGEDATDIPVVATVSEPNLEAILEARPDLILAAAGLAQEQYDALSAIAPTIVPEASTGGDWRAPLPTYAEALGAAAELTAELRSIEERAAAVARDGGLDGSAAVIRWMANGPLMMNADLMPGTLLRAAGASSIQAAAELGSRPHSDPLSLENLAEVDADRLFVAAFGTDGPGALEAARSQPAFQQLAAVRSGHVVEVDGSVWSSASGPLAADLVMDDIEAAAAS